MKKFKKFLLISLFSTLFLCLLLGAFFVGGAFLSTENVYFDKSKLILSNSKITLYDNSGTPLTAYADNAKTIKLSELNDYTKNAFISIEDKNFYSHNGINPKRMVKALLNNIKSGYIKEGASTISQQLIKNTHLKNEKTIKRKIKEIMLTTKLENSLSKDDILETYLNVIYFGNSSFGIESASLNYFNKPAKDLSIAQSALLAGLIKSPNTYSPLNNMDKALNRRNLVLQEMKKDGYITSSEYDCAINEEIVLVENKYKDSLYEQGVLNEASIILGLNEKSISEYGYKIFTYLDSDLQENLDTIIDDTSFYHKNSFQNIPDSQAVVMDKLGHIIAYSGKSKQNLVNLKRSPASTLKPILCYTPAIEKNLISPASIIKDEKININGYSPNNVGNTFSGNVSVRYAVEKSLNIPSVKVLQMLGLDNGKNFARKVGIEFSNSDNNYALALGAMTQGVNLRDLVGSYTILCNNGYYSKPTFISKIEDSSGRPIYINNDLQNKVISQETAFLMTDILKSSTKNGTSKRLSDIPFDVAGKTGTHGIKNTNLNTDAYSLGYTTEHLFGVWFGNPTGDNKFNLEGSNNGGTYATSMLKNIIKSTYKDTKPQNFSTPSGIEKVELDNLLLKEGILAIANSNTPDIYKTTEVFSKNNLPVQVSTNFEKCETPNLNAKYIDDKIVINFETSKINKYYLYREVEDQTTLLKVFNGTGDLEEYIDTNIEKDNIYTFYIKCQVINPLSDTEISSKSEKVRVATF
ncbi:MAG: transglycosylase domain-containing protein [Clostridia bacterium]|nr:transglycosylase domain-containing protein [Clostridia bacterium]